MHNGYALIKQGKGEKVNYEQLKAKLAEMENAFMDKEMHPEAMSVIVHFQYPSEKLRYLRYVQNKHLFNTCSDKAHRSLCCSRLSPEEKFEGRALLVDNVRLGKPEDILWENLDVKFC